jgi:hypothetical protein
MLTSRGFRTASVLLLMAGCTTTGNLGEFFTDGGAGAGGTSGGGGASGRGGQAGGASGTSGGGGGAAGTGRGGGAAGTGGAACPPSGSAAAIHFVDPAAGTDDVIHGGGYGTCGYRTLTYALTQATGAIALQTAIYSAASGETFPIILKGTQKLFCKYMTATGATIRGMGTRAPIGEWVSVLFEGTSNALYDCFVDGFQQANSTCVRIRGANASAATPHEIRGADIGNCPNGAIYVEDSGHVMIADNKLHDGRSGIGWVAATVPGDSIIGQMVNNSFSATQAFDIGCNGPLPNVNGYGNLLSTTATTACYSCANCPYF